MALKPVQLDTITGTLVAGGSSSSGGGVGARYLIPAGETVVVPVGHTLIVDHDLRIEGNLVLRGRLRGT